MLVCGHAAQIRRCQGRACTDSTSEVVCHAKGVPSLLQEEQAPMADQAVLDINNTLK